MFKESLSPPLTEATRQKVDGILKSKGLGKSLEDLLSATSKEDNKTDAQMESPLIDVETTASDEMPSVVENSSPIEVSTVVETSITAETPTVTMTDIVTPDNEMDNAKNDENVTSQAADTPTDILPTVGEPVLTVQSPVEIVVENKTFESKELIQEERSVVIDTTEKEIDELAVEQLSDDQPVVNGAPPKAPSEELVLNNNNNTSADLAWVKKVDPPTSEEKQAELHTANNETVQQEINQPDIVSSEIVNNKIDLMEEKPVEAPTTNGAPIIKVIWKRLFSKLLICNV